MPVKIKDGPARRGREAIKHDRPRHQRQGHTADDSTVEPFLDRREQYPRRATSTPTGFDTCRG